MKQQSQLLRGTIREDLHNELTSEFLGDNLQLIRPHGIYQQDGHDIRQERAAQMLEPLHTMTLRVRLPDRIINPQQWLGIDEFVSQHTLYDSIRITSRQALQLHGVLRHNIKSVHRLLHRLGLDSRTTADDVNHNVLCASNPVESKLHYQAYEWAKKISEHLLPKTSAYAEVWLDGEKITQPEEKPILGNNYLPCKSKTAVVILPQDDVDLHANGPNFITIGDNGQLTGFDVPVGGGLAMTHDDQNTYPHLAVELGYIPLNATLTVATAAVATQRDLGNRADQRNAKTRYIIDRLGIGVFKVEVELRADLAFQPLRPYAFSSCGDRIGWVGGIDDRHHLTLFIPSGRLIDKPSKPLRSGLTAITAVRTGDLRLTPNQNIIIAGVSEYNRTQIDTLTQRYSLTGDTVSPQRKSAMARVSYPTCPLTMVRTEHVLPDIIDCPDAILVRNGIADRDMIFRITDCPNGCDRTTLTEIDLIGRVVSRYNMYLDDDREETRIPRLYEGNQPFGKIIRDLDVLLSAWAQADNPDEAFDDPAIQAGIIRPVLNSNIDFYLQG